MQTKPDPDPVLSAIAAAPLFESSPDEARAFDAGLADIRARRVASEEDVRASISHPCGDGSWRGGPVAECARCAAPGW